MTGKILYFVTEDWYFSSHRLNIARASKEKGMEVIVVTRVDKHLNVMLNEGFKVYPLNLVRSGKNIIKELICIKRIIDIYIKEKPDIVHHVALKPILYGSIAANITKIPYIVNAFPGLGYIFSTKSLLTFLFKRLLVLLYRIIFSSSGTIAIFQNIDNMSYFVKRGIITKDKAFLIRGSGVDTHEFLPKPEPDGVFTVMMASRMLWDKGVGEMIEAAKIFKTRNLPCRVVLVGKTDPENPNSVPDNILRQLNNDGIIQWWGYKENMAEIISMAHIIVLPTIYDEGVPKVLIEAASCARPIITTNMPGCRDIVRDNENGILIEPNDIDALTNAILKLMQSPELRDKMGKRGRAIVIEEFSTDIVVNTTTVIYENLLNKDKNSHFTSASK
ncbi:group 1 glycosyl transferase [Candidatus Magnetoovum chiemensis]|nr:group 1 glycosyl transferase [Candidatus Magnetoovum chiemensis]